MFSWTRQTWLQGFCESENDLSYCLSKLKYACLDFTSGSNGSLYDGALKSYQQLLKLYKKWERKKTGAVIICVKITGIVRPSLDVCMPLRWEQLFAEALYKRCPNIIVHKDFQWGMLLDVSYWNIVPMKTPSHVLYIDLCLFLLRCCFILRIYLSVLWGRNCSCGL